MKVILAKISNNYYAYSCYNETIFSIEKDAKESKLFSILQYRTKIYLDILMKKQALMSVSQVEKCRLLEAMKSLMIDRLHTNLPLKNRYALN